MPVVLNGDAGSRPDMVAAFFKWINRHFANEVAVFTPNGRLLAAAPADGLAKWRAMPAAERRALDDLGPYDATLDPTPPPGGLVLKVYARALVPGAGGRLGAYKTEVTRSLEPGRDHLWLTAAEAKALLPANLSPGAQAAVPDGVADRVCRRTLLDLVRVGGTGGPRRPDKVPFRALGVMVEAVDGSRVRLRLDGAARVTTDDPNSGAQGKTPKVDEYTLQGVLEYDTKRGTFTRFDAIAISDTGHYDEVHRKVLPLGIAYELTPASAPADRVPPTAYGKDYFAAP